MKKGKENGKLEKEEKKKQMMEEKKRNEEVERKGRECNVSHFLFVCLFFLSLLFLSTFIFFYKI
jgi:hypothetical protein